MNTTKRASGRGPTEAPLPEGWSSIRLGDLLTDQQIKRVVRLVNDPKTGDHAKTQALKACLRSFGPQLEAKGVVPDYLAYWLMWRLAQGGQPESEGL